MGVKFAFVCDYAAFRRLYRVPFPFLLLLIGDMIMIRTLRSVTAKEIPKYANCKMLMILKRVFAHKRWSYVVTDQILLKEEYVQKP